MNCSICQRARLPHSKYLVVFTEGGNGAVRIEVGCEHFTPADQEKAIAILNGAACAGVWFDQWLSGLNCKHD